MKEIVLYCIAATSSLVILGYSVHMFLGGLVNPQTEAIVIAAAVTAGAIVIGIMAWDVIRRRRR